MNINLYGVVTNPFFIYKFLNVWVAKHRTMLNISTKILLRLGGRRLLSMCAQQRTSRDGRSCGNHVYLEPDLLSNGWGGRRSGLSVKLLR